MEKKQTVKSLSGLIALIQDGNIQDLSKGLNHSFVQNKIKKLWRRERERDWLSTLFYEAKRYSNVECMEEIINAACKNDNHSDSNRVKEEINKMIDLSVSDAVEKNNEKVLKFLVEKADADGVFVKSSFVKAIIEGHWGCLKILLKKWPEMDVMNSQGESLIGLAAKYGEINALELIMNASDKRVKELNSLNKQGLTPLMNAAKRGHLDCVVFLLKSGADPNIKDHSQRDAFMHAEERKRVECAEFIKSQQEYLILADDLKKDLKIKKTSQVRV